MDINYKLDKKNIIEREFLKFINSDRYQYTESAVYLKNNMENKTAVFDVFMRTKNENDFGIAAGIEEVIQLIDTLNETAEEEKRKILEKIIDDRELTEYISKMKFQGSIRGVRNGEIIFSNEPIITITAPLIQCKILETPILNIINHQIMAASAMARIIMEAGEKKVLFLGTRRNAGFESAMASTKAAYITGCSGHSNIAGEYMFDWKSTGTMTHAYIQSFGMTREGEHEAFDLFIKAGKARKAPLIMLVDTYDTIESGLKNAIKAFKDNGVDDNYEGIYGIRIDSGNLSEYAYKCKELLLKSGFYKAKIILTGGLNEEKIRKMTEEKVPADILGVGDAVALPENIMSLVYKMSRINEQDVMKISNNEKKMSYPGSKIIYRKEEENNFTDCIVLEGSQDNNLMCKDRNRKLTLDYIKNGEKNEENCELLSMENSKRYFLENKKNLDIIYENKRGNKNKDKKRALFSDEIERLKRELIKKVKG